MSSKFIQNKNFAKPLTEVELEMMQVLWRIGPSTVNQMQEALSSERDLAYTSISTIVRILEQKKYVKSQKEGRGHIYAPTISKDDYQKRSTQHFVKKVFDGAPSLLMKQLLQSDSLTAKDLQELQMMLEKKEKDV